MFDRRYCLILDSTKRFEDRISLAADETKEERFKSWVKEKTVQPSYCCHHPRTRLKFSREDSGIFKVYKEAIYRTERISDQPEVEANTFDFKASFRCPACLCAYALCPPEFHETGFDTFDTSTPERMSALARCREFVTQVNTKRCGFMLLVGVPGCGKTRLACNIIRELHNHDSLYVRQGQLTCALRATYGRKEVYLYRRRPSADERDEEDEPSTPLEIVQQVRYLVLDEIGCNPLANDELLVLDEMLKHRYDHRKPTILVSNLPLTGAPNQPGLKDILGDALTDRIVHATGSRRFLLQFSGESYRRTGGGDYLSGLSSGHK